MATLLVNAGGATGASGTFTNLEAAVAAANSGDTIVLAAGNVLLEDPNAAQDGQVFISDSINIIGAGKTATTITATTSIANADQTSSAAMITVNAGASVNFASFTLDGGDVGADVNVATGILFLGSGNALNMVIRNIGSDVEAEPRGRGINVFGAGDTGTVFVDGVDFSQNERGGVGAFDGRNVVVQNSTFTAKAVDDDESPTETVEYGVDNQGANVSVSNSTFTGYSKTQARPGTDIVFSSAAIESGFGGNLLVNNSTFTDNLVDVALGFFANDPNFGSDTGTLTLSGTVTSNSTVPGALAVAGLGDVTINGAGNLTGNTTAVQFEGGAGANTVVGGTGNDTLNGNDGADDFTGGIGNDTILGGGATDTARFTGDSGEYTFTFLANGDLQVTDTVAGRDGTDVLRNVEQLIFANGTVAPAVGSGGAETVPGTNGQDVINAAGGDDTVNAGGGNDTVDGGSGDDRLFGDTGNDAVNGGTGDDLIDAGAGNDVAIGGTGDDTVTGGTGDDYLAGGTGNDGLFGGDDNDSLNGESGDDYLAGGIGNDGLFGGSGNDSLNGESGNDYLVGGDGNDGLFGGVGDDGLLGQEGNDYLVGEEGNDSLLGGADDDSLIGGSGSDYLVGEAGADTFIFAPGSGVDTIADFTTGEDRINLSAYDTTFEAVRASATSSGANTVIDLGDGNLIVLLNTAPTDLRASDFDI